MAAENAWCELMDKGTNSRFNSEWFQKSNTIRDHQSDSVNKQAFPGGDAAASESTAGIFTHAGLQPPELPELKRTFGTDQAKWIEMEHHQMPRA